jgi:hypothetical protein
MVIMGKGAIDATKTSVITNRGATHESITRRRANPQRESLILGRRVMVDEFVRGTGERSWGDQ